VEQEGIPETEGPLFNPPAFRRDVRIYKVQEHVYFQVYWKEFGPGKGPAVLLYLFGIETLKFDIYGKDTGHFHVNPNNPQKGSANVLWMREDTESAQVERAMYELRHNIDFYLQRNVDPRIHSLEIDSAAWNGVLDEVRERLLHLLDTIPKLAGT
jgi:hypothetical protein